MDRRKFLVAGATVAPAALAAPAVLRAETAHDWKLVTSLPKKLPVVGDSALRWAERVTKMSNGEIKVTVYGGGELVPPFGTQEAVENGTAQVYHGSGSWFSGRDLAHAFFTSAPFGLDVDEMHAWMYDGGGQDLLNEFTNPRGLQIFVGGASGVQTAGWFKKPIESVEDLQGLNFRITGFGGKVLDKIGMNPVSMPAGEIFPALQSGTLDGAEWVGPSFDLAFGLPKIMSHMYTPSFADVYGGLEFGINMEAWDALSDDLKAIVEVCCEAESIRMIAASLHGNMIGLEKLEANEKITIGELPEDVWDAIRTASKEVMEEAAASNDFMGKITKSYYDYVEKAAKYKSRYNEPFSRERAKYFG